MSLLTSLQDEAVGELDARPWQRIADGFRSGASRTGEPCALDVDCGICRQKIVVVRRRLISGAYNLPDAAVYQRLRRQMPCVALGRIDPGAAGTTMSRRPAQGIREAWQALMWDVYRVAFVDVEDGRLGQFNSQAVWMVGKPVERFLDLVGEIGRAIEKARREGGVPRGNSVATAQALEPVLTPVLEEFGVSHVGFERGSPAFWWWHPVDLLYRQSRGGATLAIEVKVDEDWEHPINQPLAALLAHNAVINIRIPTHADRLDSETRRVVDQAEALLAATGRAAFLVVR